MSKQERDARHDQKRRKQQPWRSLYKTKAWQMIRAAQLAAHPLCQRHLRRGRVVRACTVHHLERHNGDEQKFFAGPFESLCKPCHDSDTQSEERTGYSREIGEDGWPVDPSHPANRAVN
jgi:5-methylcytosine-specific restriction enzyme A